MRQGTDELLAVLVTRYYSPQSEEDILFTLGVLEQLTPQARHFFDAVYLQELGAIERLHCDLARLHAAWSQALIIQAIYVFAGKTRAPVPFALHNAIKTRDAGLRHELGAIIDKLRLYECEPALSVH